MSWPFVPARYDYGPRNGPPLGFVIHMAEGGNTVHYLATAPARGVSVHYVIEGSGRVVQMLREDHASGSINPREIRTDDDPDGFYGRTTAVAVLDGWANDPNSAVISVEVEGFADAGPNDDQVIGLQALLADVRSRHGGIGLLGHRDFTTTKACPGKLIPWALIGGHGPQEDTVQAPITSEDEKIVTTAAKGTWYDLDAKTVLSTGHPALPARSSPYGVGTKRAIFAEWPAGSNQRRLVLVAPATVVPLPPPVVDCDAVVSVELSKAADRASAAVKARP